jgi:transposase
MRPYGTQKQLEKRRRHAIELLKNGYTLSVVAKKLGCSPGSVFLWRQMYQQGGEDAMKPKPAPGRPPKLTPGQKKALTRILLKGPLSLGYHTDLWTQRRVAEVIEKRFGIGYHPNHLWRFLTALGWSCQKPEKRARERDEKAIQHWKRYEWLHIKKRGSGWCPSGLS